MNQRPNENGFKHTIITRGQFCTVDKVVDESKNTVFAVKNTILDDERAPHSAIRETKLLNQLNNQFIIHVQKYYEYTNSEGDKVLSLYMDYLPYTLTQYLLNFGSKANFPTAMNPSKWRNTLPSNEALRISEQITSGISYLHENGIIHRDIKPDNILFLNASDTPTIIDLDVSWKRGYNPDELEKPTIHDVGTACYRAPELLFGLDYSTSLDIWGLACIIWKIYTSDPTDDLFGPYTTDISLISCQFEKLGMPNEHEWPQAMDQSEVFRSMVRNSANKSKLSIQSSLKLASDPLISTLLNQMFKFEASLRPTAENIAKSIRNRIQTNNQTAQ